MEDGRGGRIGAAEPAALTKTPAGEGSRDATEPPASAEATRRLVRSSSKWWGGMYVAVLPAAPDVSVDRLWDACQQLAAAAAEDANVGAAFQLVWRFQRTCTLVHPQLSRPLPYLEVSGLVASQESCQRVVDALMTKHSVVVGNAELLLALEGTEIPLLPLEMPTADGSLDSLDRCGVVAIPDAVTVVPTTDIDDDILDEVREHSLGLFDVLRQRLASRKGGRQQHRYREIMQRDPNRYDFRLDLSLPPRVPPGNSDENPGLALSCWERLERSGTWLPLVRAALGDDAIRVKCGCVISLPGAGDQYWHSDGQHVGPALRLPPDDELEKDEETSASERVGSRAEVHPPHALCVFVPLVSLTEETGATEFWVGSHRYDQLLAQKGEASLPGGTLGYIERGGAVVYDYRVVHRGTANNSQAARPIAYYLYVRPGYESVEDQNFTSRSIWDDDET